MTRIEEERIDEMLARVSPPDEWWQVGLPSTDVHAALTELKELRAQGGVRGPDSDSIRILGRFADQYRSGAQGAEMNYDAAQMLALAIDDALSALETEAVDGVNNDAK